MPERGWLSRILQWAENHRGWNNERLVERALEELRCNQEIVAFISSKQLDEMGVDFLVTKNSTKWYPFQVKSSRRGVRKALRKSPSGLIFIVPRHDETTEDLASRIMNLISEADAIWLNGFSGNGGNVVGY